MKRIIPVLFLVALMFCDNGKIIYGSAEKITAIKTDAEVLRSTGWQRLAGQYPNTYFHSAGKAMTPEILADWWTVLGDEELSRLVGQALTYNRELQAARAKVNEARAALGVSQAALLPWLDGSGSWSRTQVADNAPKISGISPDYQLGIDASWEIDVFGGQRQKVKAAAADLEAEHAALYAAWVSLSAEVALNYISLRTYQEQLWVAEQQLTAQQETEALLRSKYAAGLINELPLKQSAAQVNSTRALFGPLRKNLAASVNRLALLTGQVPGSLEGMAEQRAPLPEVDNSLYIGIPADALRQRPDILEAERRLAAQLARTKEAKADLWPKFSLLGSIGLKSVSSGSLFSSGSKGFSFGPQITLPIFHAGAIRKNIKVQTAREEQLLAVYEQTVLSATEEVRNALVAVTQEEERSRALRQDVEDTAEALAQAGNLFAHGLTDYQKVLDIEQSYLSLQEQYVVSQGQQVSDLIRLFKALGGGWQPLAAEESERAQAAKQADK